MTRKEEIIQTAKQKQKEVGFTQIVKDADGVNSAYGIGFLEGAKCADNHPYLTRKDIVKEVDLEKEIQDHIRECLDVKFPTTNIELIKKDVEYTARKFFEIGIKAQKGE